MPIRTDTRPRRPIGAVVVFAAYAVFVAFVTFWPVPIDRPFLRPLLRFLGSLRDYGIRPIDAYNLLESGMNVLFFIPAGLLLMLVVGRRRWWLAPLCGLAASSVIEVIQYAFLLERFASLGDVVANTLGALAGAGLGVLVWRRRARKEAARALAADELAAAQVVADPFAAFGPSTGQADSPAASDPGSRRARRQLAAGE